VRGCPCLPGGRRLRCPGSAPGAVAFPAPRQGLLSDGARLVRLLSDLGFIIFLFFYYFFWHSICKSPPEGGGEGRRRRRAASLGVRRYIMPRSAVRSWQPSGDVPEAGAGKGAPRELFFQPGRRKRCSAAELRRFLG